MANVVQRGRTSHFRRRVPADLRRRLGRHELVCSSARTTSALPSLGPGGYTWPRKSCSRLYAPCRC
ncbi:DUF6538 domain-containing protein [Methylobacterium sp. 37f]|uniref:DUF6538 domain-containing protein n=1 Tax=Methylobacterium sp. 37f TaxID=2817058 RepID=UPI0032B467A3